jgi:hypothetical protein
VIRNVLLLYLFVLLVRKKEEDQNKIDLINKLSLNIHIIMIYTKTDFTNDLYNLINDNLSNRNNKFIYDYYKIGYNSTDDFFIIKFIKSYSEYTIYVKFNNFENINVTDEIVDSFYINYKDELLYACHVYI